MVLLSDIQNFIINSLKNDAEFNNNAEELLGKDIEYHIDTYSYDAIENLPSLGAYGLEKTTIKSENITVYTVQFVLTDVIEERAIKQDDVFVYPKKQTLEKVATNALILLNKELKAIGIKGNCRISMMDTNIYLTPVGEADDVQAVVTMQLEEHKFI